MNLPDRSKKITVRVSKRLKTEMQAALVQSGFGLHGKSRWLKAALASFLTREDFVEYVDHGSVVNQAELTEVEAFYLDTEIILKLKAALVKVRVNNPLFEGVQSALIRSAIIYTLMLRDLSVQVANLSSRKTQ